MLSAFFFGAALFLLCSVLGAFHAASTASAAVDSSRQPVIILDAGHGGEDGGAVAVSGVDEKDINLAVALLVRDKLVASGFSVQMIRETDTAVGDTALSTLSERKRSDIQYRTQVVNETENCILVSIHQNYFEQSQYSGAQMFYSPNNTRSAQLAEAIRRTVVAQTQPENTRQNKQAESGIYLLSHVDVPAVIVECGFLSNPEEADLLNTPDYQQRMAAAISDGIADFLQSE